MDLAELICRFRAEARDDTQPYLWPDSHVAMWLNDAEEEAAVRGRMVFGLPEIDVPIVAGQNVYDLDPLVYEIRSAQVVDRNGHHVRDLEVVSLEWLDENECHWRDWYTTHPRAGHYLIQSDTGVQVVGRSEPGERLVLSAYRLPLRRMRVGSDRPEISAIHHRHLVLWALHKAFGVPDGEHFDATRSQQALAEFERYFGRRPDSDLRRITRQDQMHTNECYY